MKTILLSISFIIIGLNSVAQMDRADSAYSAQNYTLAIQYYTQLIADNYNSAELYYNLGNAYYKNNEIGKSIWAYQKAKKIDPSNDDINYNLSFVSDLTKDKIEQSKGGIGHWFSKVLFGRSINFWAWMGVVMSILSVAFIFIYRNAQHRSFRSLYALTSAVCGICILICIVLAIVHKNHITNVNHGIIVEPVVKVMTAPDTEESVSFELHEGAKFSIIKTEGKWVNVALGKNQGWVEKKDVLLY